MAVEIVVALIAFVGTAVGSVAGVLTANRLVMYRISQLEKKVEKHNNVMERTYILEEKLAVANHRIKDLEEVVKP
ncbi:MAG TPA: hypothetical protein GX401_01200 [Clostridiales bacterium]|nr:hypothetical protein [Clostridiales bacterium]